MADWPTGYFGLPGGTINPMSSCCLLNATSTTYTFSAAAVWPAANRAIYMPFYLEKTVTAYQIGFVVAVQSGNLDVGIYDEYGVRLVSQGSTGVGAAGIQRVNIADTVLNPGMYYMAMCVDNTTASFNRISGLMDVQTMEVTGLRTQAVGAVTLPNPATFAVPASTYVPLLAVGLNATW